MSGRRVFHVSPEREGGWTVDGPGMRGRCFERKTEAVTQARRQARKGGLGQIVIHTKTGRIQEEHTYGKDPREYED